MNLKGFRTKGILIVLILLPSIVLSQATVRGRVIDAESGDPLPSATVLVKERIIGTRTDEGGNYELSGLDSGVYYLQARHLGYKKQTRKAVIQEGDTLTLDFGLLRMATEMDSIEISSSQHRLLEDPMLRSRMASEEVERKSATNTAELLEDEGGVSVARAGNWGAKPYFQGMTDNRVVTYIDGIKTTQACPMGMDACAATIEPDMINSMEVQTGPGGAEYGSGNMGGVLRIETSDPQYRHYEEFKADLEASTRYKSVTDSRTGVLGFRGGNKQLDLSLKGGGGWHDDYKIPERDEYTVMPEQEVPNSRFSSKWLHGKVRFRPDTGHQISFISQIYRGDSIGWPSRMADTRTVIPREERDLFALKYRYKVPRGSDGAFEKLELQMSYQPMQHDMVNFLPSGKRYRGVSDTRNYQASVKSYFSVGKRHAITLGLESFTWKMHAERRTITDTSRTPYLPILNQGVMYENGVFILDRFTYEDLSIDAGLRLNHVLSDGEPAERGVLAGDMKDQGFIWSGNIAIVHQLNEHLALSGALVKGYRAATPVDRFVSAPMLDGFYHYGKPDLKPETNINKRVGLRGMHDKWSWNLEAFRNDLNQMIERRVDDSRSSPISGLRGVKRSRNIRNASISGAKAYLAYYATPKVEFSLSASYLYGVDGTGDPLPNIAPFNVHPQITYEKPERGLWLTLRADMASEQTRYAPRYGEVYTPGYVTFDLSGGWEPSEGVELSAGVNNLSNRYYRKHLNQAQLPEPGMNLYASAAYTLPAIGADKGKPDLEDAELVTMRIEGMACRFCAQTVKDRSEKLPQVVQSIVKHEDDRAEIIVGKRISMDELIRTIQRAGFQVHIVSVEPYEE